MHKQFKHATIPSLINSKHEVALKSTCSMSLCCMDGTLDAHPWLLDVETKLINCGIK